MKVDVDKLPPVFWLTRDTIHGDLIDSVDVWVVQPVPERHDNGDVNWCAMKGVKVDEVDTCVGDLPSAEAAIAIGTIPTSIFECVRHGPGPAKASA